MAKKSKNKKLNCPTCEKGNLFHQEVLRQLEIDGAPKVEVSVSAEVCNNCGETVISEKDIVLANKYFLEKLLLVYLKNPSELPGKVATWIRKEISMSARELADLSGLKESTISHANANNSVLDRFAATVLLLSANDKLKGTSLGKEALRKLSNLDEFWKKEIPTAEIVQQIKSRSEIVRARWMNMRKGRTSTAKAGSSRAGVEVRKPRGVATQLGDFKNRNPYGFKKVSHKG